MPTTPINPLDQPVSVLYGVGTERAAQLARLKIATVHELLLHRPRRYEDRRHLLTIAQMRPGESATTRGRIVAQGLKRYRKGAKSVFELVLDDGTARLHCRWWNLPFLEKFFRVGDEVMVYGRLGSIKPRTIDHPETEVLEAGEEVSIHLDRIVPIYPLTEGLPQRWLRSLVWRTLGAFEAKLVEAYPDLQLKDLPTRANALHMLHFPEELSDVEVARQRLALDEFLDLQVAIQRRRRNLQARAAALPCAGNNQLIRPFLKRLHFALTDAQTRVLREIRHDLGGAQPMRRLLQGDVGAGKTVVAACAALMALESGFNVALMAPTEILAEQHFASFRRWFEPLGVAVHLLTGNRKSTSTERPASLPAGPAQPRPEHEAVSLFVGTHALLETSFAIDRLGLAIIDEQHKFGVAQRERLVRKGRYPHLLVMTATPIPRTLGLTLYGDLDISVIDQMPAGRGRVRTFVRSGQEVPKVYEFIRQRIEEGRQAYVVYARVEEADPQAGVKAVALEYERLRKEFAPHRVGLVHGRLPAVEKEQVMTAFRNNTVSVLLATSVIEVGVDVPNATILLVENAEQFGLAQLHQLRGRIGRGAHEAYCILVADLKSPGAGQRLRAMEETADGFRIAEIDLKLRGPGELLGSEQSGLPSLRFGDLARDLALVERARGLAREVLDRSG